MKRKLRNGVVNMCLLYWIISVITEAGSFRTTQSNGNESRTCNLTSGECLHGCKDGFVGSNCKIKCPENCAFGNLGENICEPITGNCLFGCKDGFYGENCTKSCKDAIASCKRCSIGQTTSEVVCDECIKNFYRENEKRCIVCNYWCRMAHNSSMAACREHDGYCYHGCKEGRYGFKCGVRCSSTCKDGCHRETGYCEGGCKYPSYCGHTCGLQCQDGCAYQYCNQTCDCVKGCTSKYWGEQCGNICNVNCVKPSDSFERVCNNTDGTCIFGCDGKKFWGNECNKPCSYNCVNGTCEQNSGNCTDGCTTDTVYDLNCDKPCNKNCIGGICKRADGYCKSGCKVGSYGTKCNMNCSKTCLNDSCTREKGNCTYGCVPGYADNHCLTDCGSLKNPENGYVIFGSTKYNSFAKSTCKDGYYSSGNDTSVCTATGRWSNIPKCKIIDCGLPRTISNGAVTIRNGTTFKSIVTYTCDVGYYTNDSTTSLCQANKIWNGSAPNCSIKDCGNLVAPEHGFVDVNNGTVYQSVGRYFCEPGYTLYGDNITQCLSTGNWSKLEFKCTINDCGKPKRPVHGSVQTMNGTTYMSQIMYKCDTGYDLIGDVTSICQANKRWSSVNQSCKMKEIAMKMSSMCFSCDGMSSPEYCDRVEYCQQNQICYTESYQTNYGKIFRSGCIDVQKCHNEENNTLSSVCVQCCTADMCNNKGCGNTDFPPREHRGPMCFDCQHIGDTNSCRKVTMCSSNQVCSVEKQQWGDSFHYKLGCTHHLCNSLSHEMFGSVPSCHACCKEDYCNRNCTSSNPVPGENFVG